MTRARSGAITAPQTARLVMRPLSPGDAPILYETLTDPYARRFFGHVVSAPEDAVAWVERQLARYARDGVGLWGLELRVTGALVGDCGLLWQDIEGRRELEVGYHIHPAHRGRGYAAEAARACLTLGLTACPCPRIVSLVHPENVASRRVAERVHRSVTDCVWQDERYLLYFTARDAD